MFGHLATEAVIADASSMRRKLSNGLCPQLDGLPAHPGHSCGGDSATLLHTWSVVPSSEDNSPAPTHVRSEKTADITLASVSPFRASTPFTDSWDHFRFDVDHGVATVTFDRPEKLNALTFDVYADLRDLLAELEHRDDVRVLAITGEGKGFCSGGDVDEIIGQLLEMDSRGLLEFTRMTGTVVERMRRLPMPIVAAVNGVAAGAGAVIALAADLRLMARSASFHFLFTKVGLAGADMGSAYLLPRVVGLGRATEMLLLGEKVEPTHAVSSGLASRVVDDDDLIEEAASLARRLADGPSLAFGATKILLSRELDMDLGSSIEMEAMTQALLMTTEDHAEFYRAFTGKRSPEWSGR
jgi:enoyl-CoA hydratase/carnithine racemase